MEYLYVVITATPGKMGKMLRAVTGAPMNHVSLARREDLTDLVSFARRFYRTPFYGGFVREGKERFEKNGRIAKAWIYRIPLTEEQAEKADTVVKDMLAHPEKYPYHLLDALLVPVRGHLERENAYTCLSFAQRVLEAADVLPQKRMRGIMELSRCLDRYHREIASMEQFPLRQDPAYYSAVPVGSNIRLTVGQLWRLVRNKI